jgi:hypothetical protein
MMQRTRARSSRRRSHHSHRPGGTVHCAARFAFYSVRGGLGSRSMAVGAPTCITGVIRRMLHRRVIRRILLQRGVIDDKPRTASPRTRHPAWWLASESAAAGRLVETNGGAPGGHVSRHQPSSRVVEGVTVCCSIAGRWCFALRGKGAAVRGRMHPSDLLLLMLRVLCCCCCSCWRYR